MGIWLAAGGVMPSKAELRQYRRVLRRRIRDAKCQAREALAQIPEIRERRARRRRRRGLAVLLLATLAVLSECACEQTPSLTPDKELTPAHQAPTEAAKQVAPGPARSADAETLHLPRDGMGEAPTRIAPWLGSFRMQVGARGPRLARCFEGSVQPGALRWSAAIDPISGAVSEPEVETLNQGVSLRQSQRQCMIRVLKTPPYSLAETAREYTTPRRVSIVVKF